GLCVKHLHRLEGAIDQARNTIKESKPKNVAIEKEQHRRTRYSVQLPLQPPPPLGLSSKKSPTKLFGVLFTAREHARFPIGIFIMLLNVARQGFNVVVHNRVS